MNKLFEEVNSRKLFDNPMSDIRMTHFDKKHVGNFMKAYTNYCFVVTYQVECLANLLEDDFYLAL